jgi:hypothetical protein
MATDAIIRPVSGHQPTYRHVNRTVERVFYSGMAVLLCVCVYIGFSPTYFQAGMIRAPLPSPILHVHGAVFTLWMLLSSSRPRSSPLAASNGIVPWARSPSAFPRS